jgi:hypothetical protein
MSLPSNQSLPKIVAEFLKHNQIPEVLLDSDSEKSEVAAMKLWIIMINYEKVDISHCCKIKKHLHSVTVPGV